MRTSKIPVVNIDFPFNVITPGNTYYQPNLIIIIIIIIIIITKASGLPEGGVL